MRALFGPVARTLSVWFGSLTLINVIGSILHPAFDANTWWIYLSFLPLTMARLLLIASGGALLAHAVRPARSGWRRTLGAGAVSVLAAGSLWNTVTYYRLWAGGKVSPEMPIPLSVVIALLLALIGYSIVRPPALSSQRSSFASFVAVSTAFVIGLPLLQVFFFGTTDYQRPADAIVVFGAKVNPDGKASVELADRVITASDLYEEGYAPTIVMSGGVESNGYSEPIVMRSLAEQQGVPASAISLDANGYSTLATVNDTVGTFHTDGLTSILAVSSFYHLPRIKLAYERAGFDVYTVPARYTPIPQTPYEVAREIPAFWFYYARAMLS